MLTVQFEVAAQHNAYTILIDGTAYCTTSNDDDGLKLMIAVALLKGTQNETKTPNSTPSLIWPSSPAYDL